MLLVILLLIAGRAVSAQERFDLVIHDGQVVDGTGAPAIRADVGIRAGRIARVGQLADAVATRRVNASGMVVAPGFIDSHAHAVDRLFEAPTAESYLKQGITTLVDGNDGSSPFPIGAFLDSVARVGISPNLALFVGHGTIRREVMGGARRTPTADEMRRMGDMVAEGMQQGAMGLSTGLAYVPGTYARTEEIAELAGMAARHGGIYVSHLRDEGAGLLNSIREAIRIGHEAQIPVQISHLKVGAGRGSGQAEVVLDLLREARSRGVDVTFDHYPYTASPSHLALIFPRWATTDDRLSEHLADPARRARVVEGMIDFIDQWFGDDPSRIQLVSCSFDASLAGKTLEDLLRARGRSATVTQTAELIIELHQRGGCQAVFHSYDEAEMERLLQSDHGMVASDGALAEPDIGAPHPRAYGTYPRVLGRYVRERGVLTLERAIHKMTSAPATRLGLGDRGAIAEGMAADLVVFDPERIADRSKFADPHQFPRGIELVLVNGVVVVERGRHTGARPGRPLLRSGARPQSSGG